MSLAISRSSVAVALAAALASCAATNTRSPAQEVEWFDRGAYGGVSIGAAFSGTSQTDLNRDLLQIDPSGSTAASNYDDSDFAYKILGGYRFELPVAVEAGYTNLGKVTSTVSTMSVDPSFLNQVANVHPYLGRGFFVGARLIPIDIQRFELNVGGGLWVWDAMVDATNAIGVRVNVDKDGVDGFFGAGILFDLTRMLSIRADYERYYMDGVHADVVLAGIQLRVL